jgi:hypothetical protein
MSDETAKAVADEGDFNDFVERSNDVYRLFLAFTRDLAPESGTFAERRRMCEIADFYETACPGERNPVPCDLAFLKSPDIAGDALWTVMKLGGFDAGILAAQASSLLGEPDWNRLWLRFNADARQLTHWPGGDEDQETVRVIARLFTGTTWTANVASRALYHCPYGTEAAAAIESVLPDVRVHLARRWAAWWLVTLHPRGDERARSWLSSDDAALRWAAAVNLAELFVTGGADEADIRTALLGSDDATRDDVIKRLRDAPPSPFLASLLEESGAKPMGFWICRRCGQRTSSTQASCQNCGNPRVEAC